MLCEVLNYVMVSEVTPVTVTTGGAGWVLFNVHCIANLSGQNQYRVEHPHGDGLARGGYLHDTFAHIFNDGLMRDAFDFGRNSTTNPV